MADKNCGQIDAVDYRERETEPRALWRSPIFKQATRAPHNRS